MIARTGADAAAARCAAGFLADPEAARSVWLSAQLGVSAIVPRTRQDGRPADQVDVIGVDLREWLRRWLDDQPEVVGERQQLVRLLQVRRPCAGQHVADGPLDSWCVRCLQAGDEAVLAVAR